MAAAQRAYIEGRIDLPELERRLDIALPYEQETVADDLQRLGSARMTKTRRSSGVRKRSSHRKRPL